MDVRASGSHTYMKSYLEFPTAKRSGREVDVELFCLYPLFMSTKRNLNFLDGAFPLDADPFKREKARAATVAHLQQQEREYDARMAQQHAAQQSPKNGSSGNGTRACKVISLGKNGNHASPPSSVKGNEPSLNAVNEKYYEHSLSKISQLLFIKFSEIISMPQTFDHK